MKEKFAGLGGRIWHAEKYDIAEVDDNGKVIGRDKSSWNIYSTDMSGADSGGSQASQDACSTAKIELTDNSSLSPQQMSEFKDERSRIYGSIGVSLEFDADNPDYKLSIDPVASPYTDKPSSVGQTMITNGGVPVQNRGRVFVDRLTESARLTFGSRILFDNIKSYSPSATGLARAGSHEIGHFFLQTPKHLPTDTGVMSEKFRGIMWFGKTPEQMSLWKFTVEESDIIRNTIREKRGCDRERHVNRRRESDF